MQTEINDLNKQNEKEENALFYSNTKLFWKLVFIQTN